MKLADIFANSVKMVKSNSPEILTALGVSGVVSTAYLVGKGAHTASLMIDHQESIVGVADDRVQRVKERTKLVWKCYIPGALSGVLTIGCIVGASKATGKRTAAAVTAYSITEKAFSEYREKVVEQIGKGKEEKVRDEIAQDRVLKNGPSQEVIILGNGHVLCCELFTHRYFKSDMETLRKAQNDINHRVAHNHYVTLEEFYDLIGLGYTSNSANLGWDSDKLMELKFSTVLTDSNEPCLAFEYNYTKPLR